MGGRVIASKKPKKKRTNVRVKGRIFVTPRSKAEPDLDQIVLAVLATLDDEAAQKRQDKAT